MSIWKIQLIETDVRTDERYVLLVHYAIQKPTVNSHNNFTSTEKHIRITERQLSALVDVIDPDWRNN